MTLVLWEEATRLLSEDSAFRPIVERVGPVRMPASRAGGFGALVSIIVHQQLAGRAAATIHGRVLEVLGGEVSPATVDRVTDAALRGAGLSRGKLAAIRDLAEKAGSGTVDVDGLAAVDDAEVEAQLTTVRGLGPWSARMFLMFHLHRPDVWPVGDLGVRMGWARLHGLVEPPDARALEPMGERHRPWRSAAAWYCWRALEE